MGGSHACSNTDDEVRPSLNNVCMYGVGRQHHPGRQSVHVVHVRTEVGIGEAERAEQEADGAQTQVLQRREVPIGGGEEEETG